MSVLFKRKKLAPLTLGFLLSAVDAQQGPEKSDAVPSNLIVPIIASSLLVLVSCTLIICLCRVRRNLPLQNIQQQNHDEEAPRYNRLP
jgi:hypothetical protein